MNVRRLGRIHRALRRRVGRTQRDVGIAARVQRSKISEFENGEVSRLLVPEMVRCFEALGAAVRVTVNWGGAALDRLLDEGHTTLVGAAATLLRSLGWVVQFEVTFARFADRGSIDILAWHGPTKTLLIIEIKTEIASLETLLRALDLKVRLASAIAAERFGWNAAVVARLVVLPEDRTARRVVDRHAAVLDTVFPARTREVKRWLGTPEGALAGLLFLTSSQLVGTTRNPSAIQRVRRARNPTA